MTDSDIRIAWDVGTAYDLFASLVVLHDPGTFGLRPSWAAGVRSRMHPDDRQLLEDLVPMIGVPVEWILSLPAVRDASAALAALQQLSPPDRLQKLSIPLRLDRQLVQRLTSITERGEWQAEDLDVLKGAYGRHKVPRDRCLRAYLDAWIRPDAAGERLYGALQAYYQNFFAEEAQHIRPLLHQGLAQAQEKAAEMSLPDLISDLSQGVHLDLPADVAEMVFIPSIWISPLVIIRDLPDSRLGFLFGVRPDHVSLVPGEAIPDGMLRVLKALADPTRLRLLHYLGEQTYTLAEISRKLRLRPPTVIHHLSVLRLAGLVHIALQENGERRYSLRREALPAAFESLEKFLQPGYPIKGNGSP